MTNTTINVASTDISDSIFFGPDIEGLAFVRVAGTVDGNIARKSDENSAVKTQPSGLITGNVTFTGEGHDEISNNGTIEGNVKTGGGDDTYNSLGTLLGDLNTGGGNDLVQIGFKYREDSDDVPAVITGTLKTGAGDDVVINLGITGRVNLGSGDDMYKASFTGGTTEFGIAEEVNGGAGNDTLRGGDFDDNFKGGQGFDLLQGQNGDDKLYGGKGLDTLQGGNGEDVLRGGQGKDDLFGGNGSDVLRGDSGNDTLDGGRGDDRLVGGSGADVFVFSGASGADKILDFNLAEDVIALPSDLIDGAAAYADFNVLSFITYADGNAVLDLSGLYASFADKYTFQGSEKLGSSVTIVGVAEDSLTGEHFITPGDFTDALLA